MSSKPHNDPYYTSKNLSKEPSNTTGNMPKNKQYKEKNSFLNTGKNPNFFEALNSIEHIGLDDGLDDNPYTIPITQCMQSRKDKIKHVSSNTLTLEPLSQSLQEFSTKDKLRNDSVVPNLMCNTSTNHTTTPIQSTLHMAMHAKGDVQMAENSEFLANSISSKDIIYQHTLNQLSDMHQKTTIEINNPTKAKSPTTNINIINIIQDNNAKTPTISKKKVLIDSPNKPTQTFSNVQPSTTPSTSTEPSPLLHITPSIPELPTGLLARSRSPRTCNNLQYSDQWSGNGNNNTEYSLPSQLIVEGMHLAMNNYTNQAWINNILHPLALHMNHTLIQEMQSQ